MAFDFLELRDSDTLKTSMEPTLELSLMEKYEPLPSGFSNPAESS